MSHLEDDSPRFSLRSHGIESHDLTLMAREQPSPDDIHEAVVLMRRWTRLPDNRKPEVRSEYKGMGTVSKVGFLIWLTKVCGHRIYTMLRAEAPVEAAEFRRQLLLLCAAWAEQLSRMGGSGLVHSFSRGLAGHVRHLPEILLDDAPMTEARRKELEARGSLAGNLKAFMQKARLCAHEMFANAAFIQKELPIRGISAEYAEPILEVCTNLIRIKRDITLELTQLEQLASSPGAPAVQGHVERIRERIAQGMRALDTVPRLNWGKVCLPERFIPILDLLAQPVATVRQAVKSVDFATNAYQLACEREQP